jgi:NAD(P)-dependent dehydrogenase (short-subunit alcohol dehydrogenase family)
MTLRGQGAIITGAAQGLGAAIARAYAEQGMVLALIDIQADALHATCDALRAASGADGAAITPIIADLSDAASTQRSAREALAALGRTPKVLVHNAAILVNRPLLDVTPEAFTREMNVIIQAAFLLTQAVWQPMTDAGGGSLIYVSSRSGVVGFLDESPYVAGKHALEGFMKCMALEGEPRGITANTITPGMYMRTPMSESNYSDALKQQWVDPYLLTPAFVQLAAQTAGAPGAHSGERLNAWAMRGGET